MEAVPQGGGTATRHGVAMEAVKNGIFANGEAIREKPLGGFLWVADPSHLLPPPFPSIYLGLLEPPTLTT